MCCEILHASVSTALGKSGEPMRHGHQIKLAHNFSKLQKKNLELAPGGGVLDGFYLK